MALVAPQQPAGKASSARQLSPEHREHLRMSGLSDQTIAAGGFWTTTSIHEGRAISRWGKRSRSLVPALVLPHFDLDGNRTYSYLRPDDPPLSRSTGKPVKYVSVKGLPQRPYFTPTVPRAAFLDATLPLALTEGIKKALAVAQATGLPVVSAQGTWMFHDVEAKKKRRMLLHPDLRRLPLKQRRVFIVFDGGDTTHNAGVVRAEAFLARLLLDAGADVRLVRVPFRSEKQGVDDYLARFEPQERPGRWSDLVRAALPADPVARALEAGSREKISRLLGDLSFHAALARAPASAVRGLASALGVPPREWSDARRRARKIMAMSSADAATAIGVAVHDDTDTTTTDRPTAPPASPLLSPPTPPPRGPGARAPAPLPPVVRNPAESLKGPIIPGQGANIPRRGRPARELLIASVFLALALGRRAAIDVSDVKDAAAEEGIAWRTLKRAARKLGVTRRWIGRRRCWQMQTETADEAQAATR